VAWLSFAVAMWLVLGKNASRLRVALGGTVFLVGVVGLLGFVFISAAYFPDALAAVLPENNDPLIEDFSQNRGWLVEKGDGYAVAVEGGVYAVSLTRPDINYYLMPPVSYFPEHAEVDAWVPMEYIDPGMGMFGFICRYQNQGDKFYAVVFDQAFDEYAVFHFENASAYALTDPAWLPAGGLRAPGERDRVGVTCARDQIVVSINGKVKEPVTEPGMDTFGEGPLGFLAFTTIDMPAQGYKVHFDNAAFYPPGRQP
jgi:hypothetical protein